MTDRPAPHTTTSTSDEDTATVRSLFGTTHTKQPTDPTALAHRLFAGPGIGTEAPDATKETP